MRLDGQAFSAIRAADAADSMKLSAGQTQDENSQAYANRCSPIPIKEHGGRVGNRRCRSTRLRWVACCTASCRSVRPTNPLTGGVDASESSGHAGLAQPFFKTFKLLAVLRACQVQWHGREAPKASDRNIGIVFLILRESQMGFVGETRKRVRGRKQRVRADVIRIRIEGYAQ